jgi:hypothetical protein
MQEFSLVPTFVNTISLTINAYLYKHPLFQVLFDSYSWEHILL